MPAVELIENLLPAYGPCPAFQHECASARWEPEKGFVPRGFLGAIGSVQDVRLVLLTAEPGNPLGGETYHGSPLEMLQQAHSLSFDIVAHSRVRKDRNFLFHRNLRLVLDLTWPGLSLERQLRRTWITDTYLCSARIEGDSIPQVAEQRCAASYLRQQLALFSSVALVIALGGKAKARADRIGIDAYRVFSVAPPGCNRRAARPSWEEIPRLLAERGLSDDSSGNIQRLRIRTGARPANKQDSCNMAAVSRHCRRQCQRRKSASALARRPDACPTSTGGDHVRAGH